MRIGVVLERERQELPRPGLAAKRGTPHLRKVNVNDDWKDIIAGTLVTLVLLLILAGMGVGILYLARSTPWL